jgi:UDP-N-acetylmuramoyl-tripeptide--D-alanyl-D-alanine ligase
MPELWPWLPVVGLAFAYLTWRRLLAYLRYFQQEGYEAVRFLKWANVRSFTDPAFWMAMAAAALFNQAPWISLAAFVAMCVVLGWLQPDPRKSGKIPLRLTWRATRILGVALVFALAGWVGLTRLSGAAGLNGAFIAASVLLALMPGALVLANLTLTPYERSVQQGYERDAVRRLHEVSPLVIGITGSYGKSSSKAMLAHMLQFHAPTLAATGSINTLMGITRHIRDELVTGHRFMVVEMGAFQRGSIRRLCQLTPPAAGLVTAVGDMHLERFGSTDNIIQAKSELAQAIPPGGILVVNADSPGALKLAKGATHCTVLLYGERSIESLATRVEDIRVTAKGSTFVLRTRDRVYQCSTPLWGRPIILNLAGAFTLATALGVDAEIAVASFLTLKPVSNRLEVVAEKGVTWIRDAYNSNQFGFRAALEVAAALPVNRRFLATPGVIELGAEQREVNRQLSKEAALVCDHTLVVTDTNREAFVLGHRDAGHEAKLVPVANRGEAFRWLQEHAAAGDAIILENDLPDLYERTAGLFWKERTPASPARAAS